jgi:hypothetical protein
MNMTTALVEVMDVATKAIRKTAKVTSCTVESDSSSAEIIFTVDGQDYILKLKKLEGIEV